MSVSAIDATSLAGRNVAVCIVGGGPHALAVATHLITAQPSLRHRIVVLDPSGEWLAAWRSQFLRLQIGVLRSPIVHHCEVDPGALARYLSEERLPRSALPYDPPLVGAFESFCTRSIAQHDLASLPVSARVTSLDIGECVDDHTTITTDLGTFRARHVVWTGNTCTPVIPTPFLDAMARSPVVAHAAHIDLCVLGHLTGRHVVVVGGGLSAGHLVVGARSLGASVTLLTRRPIVERDFDVEPGWLGPRHLDAFHGIVDPRTRLGIARGARGGGSIPEWMHRRIRDEVDSGQVEHLVGDIDAVTTCETEVEVSVGTDRIRADRCWLATGTTADVRADDALASIVDGHIDGIPILDHELRSGAAGPFIAGRLAMIELGPAAGNLWGARMAARRISRAITSIDLDTGSDVASPPASRRAFLGRGRTRQ